MTEWMNGTPDLNTRRNNLAYLVYRGPMTPLGPWCRSYTELLTLMLPIFLKLFFIHLKLELLTQFPAPNDEK